MADPVVMPPDYTPDFGPEPAVPKGAQVMPAGYTPEFEAADDAIVSKAYAKRAEAGSTFGAILDKVKSTASDAWGDTVKDPVGIDVGGEVDTWLRSKGIFVDPENSHMPSPLRTFNEVTMRPTATAVDALLRSVRVGVHLTGLTVGAFLDATVGDFGSGTKKSAVNDITGMIEIAGAGLFGGSGATALYRAGRGGGWTSGGDQPVAPGFAKPTDFQQTGVVLGDGQAIVEKAPTKTRQLYDEQGRHPAEVIDDANRDPTIRQSMLSAGDDVPDVYTGATPDKPVLPTAPPNIPIKPNIELGEAYIQKHVGFPGRSGIAGIEKDPALGIDAFSKPVAEWELKGGIKATVTKEFESELAVWVKGDDVRGPRPADDPSQPWKVKAWEDAAGQWFKVARVKNADDTGKLEHIVVVPEMQRQGIGERLLKLAQTEIRTNPYVADDYSAAGAGLANRLREQRLADEAAPGGGNPPPAVTGKPPARAGDDGPAGGGGGKEPPEPPAGSGGAADDGRRALPGPAPKPEEAWQRGEKHISIGEPDVVAASKATWYEERVDRLWPIDKAFKDAGLATADDPYRIARLFAGWAAKANHFMNRSTFNFHTLEDTGSSLKDIYTKVAPTVTDPDKLRRFRVFATYVRARELDLRGKEPFKGYKVADATEIVAKHEKEFGPVLKELVDYNNRVAAYARDAGLLSRKGYEAMMRANKYYMPFHRVMDPTDSGFMISNSGLEPKTAFWKIEGSGRMVIDPLETTIRNTAYIIAQAEKNETARKLVSALNGAGISTGELKRVPGRALDLLGGKITGPREAQIVKDRQHLTTFIDEHLPPSDYVGSAPRAGADRTKEFVTEILDHWVTKPEAPNEIRVFENGIPKLHTVPEDIARAFKGLDAEGVNGVTRFLGFFADALRKGALQNPVFWGMHTIRDIFPAIMTYKGVGQLTPADTARGLYHGILGKLGKSKDFDDWIKAGGGHSTVQAMNRRYLQESLEELTGQTGLMTRAQNIVADPNMHILMKGGKLLGTPFHAVSKYVIHPLAVTTEIVMEANKLGAYMRRMKELGYGADVPRDAKGLPALRNAPDGPALTPAQIEYQKGLADDVLVRAGLPKGNDIPEVFQQYLRMRDVTTPTEAMKAWKEMNPSMIIDADYTEVFLKGNKFKRDALDAAWVARETAIDTARIGSKMRSFNMITAFLNSRVQDAAVMARLMKENPVEFAVTAMSLVTLPSVMLWASNQADSRYNALPQHEKDLFWILPTDKWEPATREPQGDGSDKDQFMLIDGQLHQNNGVLFRIPKPFGLGVVMGSGPERLLEAFKAENPEPFKGFLASVRNSVVGDFYPTAAVPVIDQVRNKSTFSGTNIVPEPLTKQLPEYQYTIYTTELAKALGKMMSNLPFLRSEAADSRDLATSSVAQSVTSPIMIENYIRGWTGRLGMDMLATADFALRKVGVLPDQENKPAATLADIPYVKSFVIRNPGANVQVIQDFYEMHNSGKKLLATWTAKAKEGDLDAASRVRSIGGDAIFVKMDGYAKAMGEQQQLIQMIYKHPSMKPEEKRQLIDQTYRGLQAIARAGTSELRYAKKSLETKADEPEWPPR